MKTLGIARKVSPTFHKRYIPHISFSVRKINKLSEAAQSQKPLHYVIITDSKKIRTFSFPGGLPVSKGLALPDTSVWLKSEYFKCNDLPCLLSVTQCLHIVVHSLPGLKPLMDITSPYLRDSRVLCSFRVSGNGQALCMSSASEIQRISVVKEDRLNLPTCLPDVYLPVKDPQPCGGKGFIGALFGSGPSEINREEIFGEKAGRPSISLAKRDGRSDYSLMKEHRRTRKGGAGGVGGQMRRNVEALDQRKKDLSKLEKRTGEMADTGSEFADLADQLLQKYKR